MGAICVWQEAWWMLSPARDPCIGICVAGAVLGHLIDFRSSPPVDCICSIQHSSRRCTRHWTVRSKLYIFHGCAGRNVAHLCPPRLCDLPWGTRTSDNTVGIAGIDMGVTGTVFTKEANACSHR